MVTTYKIIVCQSTDRLVAVASAIRLHLSWSARFQPQKLNY